MSVTGDAAPPPKRAAREILREHGPAGGLVLYLQRQARLGWVLFFITAGVFIVYVLLGRLATVPVLAVDESGRVLGSFEYISEAHRTNAEYAAAVARWLDHYLSANSATIYADIAVALSLMHDDPQSDDDTRGTFLARLRASDLPNKIADSDTRSWIVHDDGYPKVIDGPDLQGLVTVHARGTIERAISGSKGVINRVQPYEIYTRVRAVPRSTLHTLGTLGIEIVEVWEG